MADITQEYTINVPDELWVDSWDDNNTATYTYTGPDTVWAVIRGQEVSEWHLTEPTVYEGTLVTIDASAQPDVADWIHPTPEDFSHTHEEATNADGSTWQRITNPGIKDWMEIVPCTTDEDHDVKLTAIIKYAETQPEIIAKERKALVEKYNAAYGFDTDTQAAVDQFITDIDTYIASYADIYPWKYINVPMGTMPTIPSAFTTAIANLPELK